MDYCSNLLVTEHEIAEHDTTVEDIQKTLTLPNPEYQNILRFRKGRFYKKVDPTICYLRKSGDKYILPRYYFGLPDTDRGMILGRKTSYEFRGKPRKYQQEFFDKNPGFYKDSGILIEMPCGHGKTFSAILRAHTLGKQTLVLVPTYFLARQWNKAIQEVTDASTVILTSDSKELPFDRDFTIVVMDLFAARVLPEEFVQNVGHVILDEAHRVGADTYMPILDELPAYYRTALTATFRRGDGVHRILRYHFGGHIQMRYQFAKPQVYSVNTMVEVKGVTTKNRPHTAILKYLERHKIPYEETRSAISFDPTKCKDVEADFASGLLNKTEYRELTSTVRRATEVSFPTLESFLSEHCGRRKRVIRIIQEALNAGRTVLFLSKRKEILKAMYKYFASYKPMLVISETNSFTDEEVRYMQDECPLVLGVTQLAKEGLDIPRLDTLIVHLPLKDTEQAIGRISRQYEGKKFPVAIYLLDQCAFAYGVFTSAQKVIAINGEYAGKVSLRNIQNIF